MTKRPDGGSNRRRARQRHTANPLGDDGTQSKIEIEGNITRDRVTNIVTLQTNNQSKTATNRADPRNRSTDEPQVETARSAKVNSPPDSAVKLQISQFNATRVPQNSPLAGAALCKYTESERGATPEWKLPVTGCLELMRLKATDVTAITQRSNLETGAAAVETDQRVNGSGRRTMKMIFEGKCSSKVLHA